MMNTKIFSALKELIDENGEDALNDITLVNSALAEKADSESKPLRMIFLLALTADCAKELRSAEETNRFAVKQNLAARLHTNEGVDLNLCNAALDLLCALLFGEGAVPETPPQTEKLEQLQKIIAEKENDNAELKKKADATEKKLRETAQAGKKKFIAVLIALGISIIITIVVSINMGNKNSRLNWENNKLTSELNWLNNQYNDSKKVWVINVNGMNVGNSNQNNKWITKPSDGELKAADVRYFNPVWTYSSRKEIWLQFYVKVIRPDGILSVYTNGSTSPAGYSYSGGKTIKRGDNSELDIGGFGDWNGKMPTGIWTIELWHEGFCLYSGKVRLY